MYNANISANTYRKLVAEINNLPIGGKFSLMDEHIIVKENVEPVEVLSWAMKGEAFTYTESDGTLHRFYPGKFYNGDIFVECIIHRCNDACTFVS